MESAAPASSAAPPAVARARRVRPYPFHLLERLARAQVDAGRAWLANLPFSDGADEAAGWSALGDALGGPAHATLVECYAFPAKELVSRLPGEGARVLLRVAGPGNRQALLALEPSLACGVARRALGRAGGDLRLDGDEAAKLVELAGLLCRGLPLRIDGLVPPADPLGDLLGDLLGDVSGDGFVVALDGRFESPAGAGWVRLFAPERFGLRAPLLRRHDALLSRRQRLSGVAVALRLEVGRTRLTRRELHDLVVGDVILFEQFGPRPPFGGPLLLRLGRGAIAAHLDGEGLTVTKGFTLGVPPMAPQDSPPPGPAVPRAAPGQPSAEPDDSATDALLRELPVELVCELGRVSLDGRELLELRPGAVIPIGRPLAGPVDLTVGNRLVARGELVDVEGEIGVRVTWIER